MIRPLSRLRFALLLRKLERPARAIDGDRRARRRRAREILVTVRQPDSLAIGLDRRSESALLAAPLRSDADRRSGSDPTRSRASTRARRRLADRVAVRVLRGVHGSGRSRRLDGDCRAQSRPRVDLAQPMNVFTTQTAKLRRSVRRPADEARRKWTSRTLIGSRRGAASRSRSSTRPSTATHPDLHGRVRVARNFVTGTDAARRRDPRHRNRGDHRFGGEQSRRHHRRRAGRHASPRCALAGPSARQRGRAVLELLARASARGRDRPAAERRQFEPRGARRSAARGCSIK